MPVRSTGLAAMMKTGRFIGEAKYSAHPQQLLHLWTMVLKPLPRGKGKKMLNR